MLENSIEFSQYIPTVINCIVIPAMIALYKWLKQWRDETKVKEQERERREKLNENAILALMRSEMLKSGDFFIHLGAITTRDKENLNDIKEAYFANGGNSFVHSLWDEIDRLPIDDLIIRKYRERGDVYGKNPEGIVQLVNKYRNSGAVLNKDLECASTGDDTDK